MRFNVKLNREQIIVSISAIFILLVIGAYVFVKLCDTSLPIVAEKRIVPTLFTKEEQVIIEKVLSEKLVPMTKEDLIVANAVLSSKSAPTLSSAEEAAVKKVLGK